MNIRDVLDKLYNEKKFICPYTDEECYEFLETAEGQMQVDSAMAVFGRKLTRINDNGAFYLTCTDPEHASDKALLKREFLKVRDEIEPVVEFLVFVSKVKSDAGVLLSGDIIRYAEILNLVTDNELHLKHLNLLVQLSAFKTVKKSTADKLTALFDGLERLSLLIVKNRSEMLYQITGKVDYVHTVMEFIAEYEAINVDEEEAEQIELMHE
ncbi:hypothetical protein [Pseudoalteromonas maricaloris]|uniref:hypothetical protein n=1 Tax=Pseudoalteromonas maricaloris TaxID=184924 RepID=UPI003C2790C0